MNFLAESRPFRRRQQMKIVKPMGTLAAGLLLTLVGCTTGGGGAGVQTHLSATQCRDLTELRNKAPANRQRSMSELAALRQAGYHPELRFDPYYPESLERAQRQVEMWYQAECPQARAG
jgi:predicted lipid-binding transport protein (Tim44 family)